jgi:hypothetical protein
MVTHFTVIGWADHRTKHSFYKLATPEPGDGTVERTTLRATTRNGSFSIPDVDNRAGKSNETRLP